MTRRLLLAFVLASLLPSGTPPVEAGGNLQEGWIWPHGFNNSYWDVRQQPIRWSLYPNDALGFDAAFIRPIIEEALATWVDIPGVEAPEFTYFGVRPRPTESLNSYNSIVFGDLNYMLGISGAIGYAPCDRLSRKQEVLDSSMQSVPGYGWLVLGTNPGAPRLLVPIGYYQHGTTLECDMIFNVLENDFSDDYTPGTHDLLSVATHEFGHWLGLAHPPIPDATMYKIITTNPPADGEDGQRSLHPDDVAMMAHTYKTEDFDANHGTIVGRVTLDGQAGDGVHVVALDAETLTPVVGRLSLPWAFNDDDRFDADDLLEYGAGVYRIDGLPPGDYYVYAEWYDGTDASIGRRLADAPNYPGAVSNVAIGFWPYWGELDFLPERFEFHDSHESADGGDGQTPGLDVDNPDAAALIHVEAGQVVDHVDIHINLDPDTTKPKLVRSDPTGIRRHDVTPITAPRAGAVLGFEGDGGGDYYVVRFSADDLPDPPYNVTEGIWNKWGRNDRPYSGGLLLGDPEDPDAIGPAIVFPTRRFVGGGEKGSTGNGRVLTVRDRFNVTINERRDLYVAIHQPETPATAQFFSEGWFVMVNDAGPDAATGRTLVTRDDFESFFVSTRYDVIYRVRTETAPPVMVTEAVPPVLRPGTRGAALTIHGAGFREGATVGLSSPRYGLPAPSGLDVREVQFIDAETLRVIVDVDKSAAGPIDVVVTNPEVLVPNRARLLRVEAGAVSAPERPAGVGEGSVIDLDRR